jgi:hypothetical protein
MLQEGRRVVVYVHLGVMRLHRNICGEVERGMVCNSRGDVTLTQAARGGHCQLWLASGRGTLTTFLRSVPWLVDPLIERRDLKGTFLLSRKRERSERLPECEDVDQETRQGGR